MKQVLFALFTIYMLFSNASVNSEILQLGCRYSTATRNDLCARQSGGLSPATNFDIVEHLVCTINSFLYDILSCI